MAITRKVKESIVVRIDKIGTVFKKAIQKIERLIYSINLVKSLRGRVYTKQIKQYRASLTKPKSKDQIILEALQKTGTYIIPIEELQIASTESFLQKSQELVNYLKTIPSQDRMFINLEPHHFADCPEIFLWGIEPRLLNIIEYYIGLPIHYQGYSLRRDIVAQTAHSECVRNWHQDAEDRTVIKIIIYLNDVGIDGGYFEYLTKELSQKAAEKLNYNLGYLSDQKMLDVMPKKYWSKYIGKRGTVIIADTASVFHRAKPPEKEDRFSISFCYSSHKPKMYWPAEKIFPQNLPEIYKQLNYKQRQALINNNKLFGIEL